MRTKKFFSGKWDFFNFKVDKKIIELIQENIYGIDIRKHNIERTKIVLTLYAIMNGEDKQDINFMI